MSRSRFTRWMCVLFAVSLSLIEGSSCLPIPPSVACRPCPCSIQDGFVCVQNLCVRTEDKEKAEQDLGAICSTMSTEAVKEELSSPDGTEPQTDSREQTPDIQKEPDHETPTEPDSKVEPLQDKGYEPTPDASEPSEPQPDASEPQPDTSEPQPEILIKETKEPVPEVPSCPMPALCPKQKGVCKGSKPINSVCKNGKWECTDLDYKAHSPDFSKTDKSCDGIDNDCSGLKDQDAPNCVVTVIGPPALRNGPRRQATFQDPLDIVRSSKGEWFVADRRNHVIRKISKSGIVSTYAGTGERGSKNGSLKQSSFNVPSGIAIDGKDNLYVTDWSLGLIRKISVLQGKVSTIAGSTWGYKDGPANAAQFYQPRGIVVHKSGFPIYTVSTAYHTIRKIDTSGNVTTYAGTKGKSGYKNGPRASALFNRPTGLYLTSTGELYVADSYNHVIRKIDKNGKVTIFAGTQPSSTGAQPPLIVYKDGPVAQAKFHVPYKVVEGEPGELFVLDNNNGLVRLIKKGVVSTILGAISFGKSCHWAGPNPKGQLRFPTGLFYSAKKLYTVDSLCNHILETDLSVTKTTKVFAGYGPPGYFDGAGDQSLFFHPSAIALDSTGKKMYIADAANLRIRLATQHPTNHTWTTTTLTGQSVVGAKDGLPGTATFSYLSALEVDHKTGTVYIAERSCIRHLDPNSKRVRTIAGHCSQRGFLDAQGTLARFGHITGMALNPARTHLYITDTENHLIRSFEFQTGQVKTFAGEVINGKPQKGYKDSTSALSAQFSSPNGLDFAANGDLLIADTGNHLIRKIDSSGKVTTLFGPMINVTFPSSDPTFELLYPLGLSIHPKNGDIFIINSRSHQVLSYNPTKQVGRLYSAVGPATKDGDVSVALFNTPAGIALDSAGTFLYVVSFNSHRIRRVRLK